MTTTKTLRKVFVVTLALVMVFAMSASAFAGTKISMKKAFNIALENAGLTSDQVRRVEKEYDDGAYSIEFTKKGSNREYDYEISKKGKILEKSVDYVYSRSKSKKKIGAKAARKKAASLTGVKYKTVKKGSCKYKYKKKQGKYTVKFKSGGYRYEVEVLAPTGDIIELEMEATKK